MTGTPTRNVCSCGHLPELHASNRFACIMRYDPWPDRRHMHREFGPRSCECTLYREARWLDLHSWWRHAAVRLWWSLSTKLRWWIVDHWPIKGRCTCDLCDSVLKAEPEWRADYAVPDFIGDDSDLYWIFEGVKRDEHEEAALTAESIPALEAAWVFFVAKVNGGAA